MPRPDDTFTMRRTQRSMREPSRHNSIARRGWSRRSCAVGGRVSVPSSALSGKTGVVDEDEARTGDGRPVHEGRTSHVVVDVELDRGALSPSGRARAAATWPVAAAGYEEPVWTWRRAIRGRLSGWRR